MDAHLSYNLTVVIGYKMLALLTPLTLFTLLALLARMPRGPWFYPPAICTFGTLDQRRSTWR